MNELAFREALVAAVMGELDPQDSVPEPPSATGVYPAPVWAAIQEFAAPGREPPSATGVYPGPVWGAGLAADDEAEEPPSATGVYPGPVWADEAGTMPTLEDQAAAWPVAQALALAGGDRIPTALSSSPVASSPAVVSLVDSAPADLLRLKEVDYQAEWGTDADPVAQPDAALGLALDLREMIHLVRVVAEADSGQEAYAACSADLEYTTPNQPAYQQRHFGLGFGVLLFTQQSGLLGKLLQIMQRRDPQQFAGVFGPDADELLAVTTAPTEDQRLRTVGGQPLTSQSWIERFRQTSTNPTFVAAQNEAAIELLFRPMLPMAISLGADTDRSLAMVFDRVVVRGLGGGLRWVLQAAGPLRTPAMRNEAVRLLQHESLTSFQQSTGWTPVDGQFDPQTHAALVGALRRQGLVPMPTAVDIEARLVAAAQGAARQRLLRLRSAPELENIRYRYDM